MGHTFPHPVTLECSMCNGSGDCPEGHPLGDRCGVRGSSGDCPECDGSGSDQEDVVYD